MMKLYLLIEENSYYDIESSLENRDFVCKTWNFQIHIFSDFNLRKLQKFLEKFITIIEWFLARIIMTNVLEKCFRKFNI